MSVEIEAKLKVESLLPIRTRLQGLNARFVANQDQQDLYCDNAQDQMVKQDKCLRVRIETTDKGTQRFITFKGPKRQADVKCREEIEMLVPDLDQAKMLLQGLGYEQKIKVHKHRELWSYKECLVGLDQVTGLGPFVEIEGPDSQTIHKVQKDLELGHVPHCQESYACLIAEKLTTNN